tara:strand:+ start:1885 stop:3762 length:1878 start_codon:yes stop_codon:yes gene_type:complete
MAYNNSNNVRDIRYTHKDFAGFKNNLIEYAKNYFPSTVKDFSEASPTTMFIEMAAYVGDVLSYYTDYAMKETMLLRATEKKNVYSIAQAFGYKPNLATPATANIDVQCLIPATGTGANIKPDFDYAPTIDSGMTVSTTTGIKFHTTNTVNFGFSSSVDPTDVAVYSTDATTGRPEYYVFTKQVTALSGDKRIFQISAGGASEYPTYILNAADVQSLDSVTDSDGMSWTEVPFLAQSTVFDESVNDVANDPTRAVGAKDTPYILQLKTVKRRFVTRVTPDDKIELRFGSGITYEQDEVIVPSPENVGSTLPGGINNLDKSFDPSNFLYTDTYGQAPSNTTLSVTYMVGYGLQANVSSNMIKNVINKVVTFDRTKTLVKGTRAVVESSIVVSNPEPATGGMGAEDIESVRQNALGYYATQNRMVTREDYVIRALSMPSRFGTVAKAYIASDEQMLPEETSISNPLAVNMYVLTYNANKQLTTLPHAAKENLRTYLSQYRLMTDAINIKDGYIVNISIDFEITVLPGHNSNAVLYRCIDSLKDKYNIKKLSFASAMYKKDIYLCLANVDGVQSVTNVKVANLYNGEYSSHRYNLDDATYQDVIYPSLDPSVFEIKYPTKDIRGKVVTY